MGVDRKGGSDSDEAFDPSSRSSPSKRSGDRHEGFDEWSQNRRGYPHDDDDEEDPAAYGATGAAMIEDDEVPEPFSALPYPVLRTGGTQNRVEASLNLLNNLLGAGLLSMPRAMSHGGLITGLLLMALIAVANRYTLLRVLELSQTQLEDSSYPEIGRHVFGQKGLLVVLAAYLLFTGGILSAYLIALTDIFKLVPALESSPRILLVALAVGICAPGAMLKSLRRVAIVSGVCMVGVCMLVVVLSFVSLGEVISPDFENVPLDDPSRPGDIVWFRFDFGRLLQSACLFALQFSIHAGGIEVLSRLSIDDPHAGGGPGARGGGGSAGSAGSAGEERDQATVGDLMRARGEVARTDDGFESSNFYVAEQVSKISFLLAATASAIIGVSGYLRFGDRVHGDVLLSFGKRVGAEGSLSMAVSRIAYGTVVTCSFAFIMVPCRFTTLDLFALRKKRASNSRTEDLPDAKFRKVTLSILGVCALIAWIVSDLAQMLECIGMWSTMALSFILPCVFMMEVKRRQEDVRILSRQNALNLALVVFGIAVCVGGSCEFLARLFGSGEFENDSAVVDPAPSTVAPADAYPLYGA